jgi:hypothetical protein
MLKFIFCLFVISFFQMSIADTSLSLWISYHHSIYLMCFAFYSLLYFKQSLIESNFNCIIVFLAISLCVSLLYVCLHIVLNIIQIKLGNNSEIDT